MPRYRTEILQDIQRHQSRMQELQLELVNSIADPSCLSPAERLPPEMFYQVFQYLKKKTALKTCREVCSTWKSSITKNLRLMKSLTFDINDANINMFMESQLATKVKSIRFQQPLHEQSEEFLQVFFIKIGTTVEQIIIDFQIQIGSSLELELLRRNSGTSNVEALMEKSKRLFLMLLRFCTKLDSLIITCQYNDYDFIQNVTTDVRNLSTLSNIQSFSIALRSEYLKDVWQLVLNLPNLRSLEFNCQEFGRPRGETTRPGRVPDIIFDHFRKYKGKLQEIVLDKINGVDSKIITKFLLSVGKYYPNVNIKCTANLNDLINFEETEELKVNGNTCLVINAGILKLPRGQEEIQTIDTSKIRHCTNFRSLSIEIFTERIPSIKLGFITQLNKLTYLRIKDFGQKVENQTENRLKTSKIFTNVMPALTTLDFDGEGLGLNLFVFHLRFPNLTKLAIRNFSGYLNKDFIYKLSSLNNLKKLTLENLEMLKVHHFTNTCDFVVEENNEIIRIPAIACFKTLHHLHIVECTNLSDDSDSRFNNALKLCKQLKKITLCDCIEKRMFKDFEFEEFEVKDLPRCHDKKHSQIKGRSNNYRYVGLEFTRFYR